MIKDSQSVFSSGQPLSGVRVVELGGIGPTPFAAALLAELGADVVRLDRLSQVGSAVSGTGLHRSRPCLALDLKSSEGREVAERLALQADVLIEGFRPGVCERLGLGPDRLTELNDQLIFARLTGWGQTGPLAHTAGHDISYAALTGVLHSVGTPDQPLPPLNLVADFAGGSLYMVVGVLAALHERERSGRGQVIDCAMVDGVSSMLTMFHSLLNDGSWSPKRGTNLLDGGAPFYRTYSCSDGLFVAVGAIEPEFFRLLVEGLGLPKGMIDEQNDTALWDEHHAAFAAAFALKPRDEWARLFADSDACVTPVLDLAEARSHPHLVDRGIFAADGNGLVPRSAPAFSRSIVADPGPERSAGQDTVAALRGWGFSSDEVEALKERGTVVQAD